MASDAFEIVSGDVRLRVEGLRKTIRALSEAGASAEEMRDTMVRIGTIVVLAGQARAPRLSGDLAGSIRPGRGKTKAVVRAGGARVPYAPVIHYGWAGHGIEPRPFLTDALQATRSQVLRTFDTELGQLLRKHNLK